jgi:hypothetical protein
VNASSIVHSAWSGQGADATQGGIITTSAGTSQVLVQAGDIVDGQPLAVPRHVAVTTSTGEVFVAEGGEAPATSRVLRQIADGTWSTWVSSTDDVSGSPIGAVVDMALRDNTNLYLATDTRVIRSFEYFNGVETLQAVWQVALELGEVSGVALTGNLASDEPVAWIGDIERQRMYERVPGGGINLAQDFLNLDLGDATAFAPRRIVGDGDDLIIDLQLEGGLTRLVRLAPDGTFTTIIGEFMQIDNLALDSIASLDVGFNGDIYIADSGNGRIVRVPASGDCATPPPRLVDIAASVNCDDQSNVLDALFIVQYEVTVRTAVYGCPLANPLTELNIAFGDVTGDGEVNVIDALFISQCEVSVPNPACPDVAG